VARSGLSPTVEPDAEGDENLLLSREHLRGEQTGMIPPSLIKEPEQTRALRLKRATVEEEVGHVFGGAGAAHAAQPRKLLGLQAPAGSRNLEVMGSRPEVGAQSRGGAKSGVAGEVD
jgi:hypothetical protein